MSKVNGETPRSALCTKNFMLERANDLLTETPPNHDAARKFFEKAYSHFPNDGGVLFRFGEFLCQMDDTEKAIELLSRSAELEPKKDPSKYFYMGQLLSGNEAVEMFLKGMTTVETNGGAIEEGEDLSRGELCSACCSIAEIFMTDLCNEDNAEENCVKYIEKAMEYDPNCAEAHHTMALYKKTIGRFTEAAESAHRALSILKDDSVLGGCAGRVDLKVNLSRTLIDLNETDQAMELLESCLREDDENIQVWYVLACGHMIKNNFDYATECVEKCWEFLRKLGLNDDPDCQLAAEVSDLEKEIKERMERELPQQAIHPL